MTIITYSGPSVAAAFSAGVMNNAWTLAAQINSRFENKIDEALTEAAGAPYVIAPTALSDLLMPALPTMDLDPSALNDSVARIRAIDIDALINDLAGGFDHFIATYFPLGDELQAAIDWVDRALTTGGTGINVNVEAQLWNRDRDRILRDAGRAEEDASASWAARGYPLPPGALSDQVLQIRRDAYVAVAASSREQAIKSFEAELENVRFAVDRAIQLRTSAISAAGEYVRTLAIGPEMAMKLAITPLEAQAKAFAATASFYQAQLAAYEIPLRLSTAQDDVQLRVRELNQKSDLAVLGERVQAVLAGAQASATQAAAMLNGFHASVGVSGSEQME